MNEDWFIFFDSVFNKIKYCFGCCIFCVEYDLVFKIKPLKSEINYTSSFPVIGYLFACTIYDMRYFVSNYKFLILYFEYKYDWFDNNCTYLCCKTVSNKKPIFDFNGSNHIFWKISTHWIHRMVHHLLLLHLLLLSLSLLLLLHLLLLSILSLICLLSLLLFLNQTKYNQYGLQIVLKIE